MTFPALGIQQKLIGLYEFSIVSAFIIAAMFFITSLALAIFEALGKELSIRRNDDNAIENEEAGRNQETPDNTQLIQSNYRNRPRYNGGTAETVGRAEDDDDHDKYTHTMCETEADEMEHAAHNPQGNREAVKTTWTG